jgi:hypothetical protein
MPSWLHPCKHAPPHATHRHLFWIHPPNHVLAILTTLAADSHNTALCLQPAAACEPDPPLPPVLLPPPPNNTYPQARDINLDIKRVVAYRYWCNKLWNAIRFAMMNLPAGFTPLEQQDISSSLDSWPPAARWILSRLNQAVDAVNKVCGCSMAVAWIIHHLEACEGVTAWIVWLCI